MLDYEYVKSHYRLITVDLSRKKEFNADPKAIQQKKFVAKSKIDDDINTDGTQFMCAIETKIFSRKRKSFKRWQVKK